MADNIVSGNMSLALDMPYNALRYGWSNVKGEMFGLVGSTDF